MSSRRLLLEGSDLPALLRRAEELGGRVLRAERLSKGLFARRWYEVTVDVPEDPSARVIELPRRYVPPAAPATGAARAATTPAPAGIDDLVAAAEAAESAERAAAARRRASRAASSPRRDER